MASNVMTEVVSLFSKGSNNRIHTLLTFNRFYVRSRNFDSSGRNSSYTKNETEEETNKFDKSVGNKTQQQSAPPVESPKQLLENAASFQERIDRKSQKRMEDVWNSAPYPKSSNWKQSQANNSIRPVCDPRDTTIILFPGQGCSTSILNSNLMTN